MNPGDAKAGKTFNLYVGGALVPSESGGRLTAFSAAGEPLAEYGHASAKDIDRAVAAARQAAAAWAGAGAHRRGQKLRWIAESVRGRVEDLAHEVSRSHGVTIEQARKGVATVIGRIEHYALRAETQAQVIDAREPAGVVIVLAPDIPVMLPMISLLLPAVLGGNTAVVLPSERAPLPALTLAGILAAGDFPGGVVNILAGRRAELVPHLAAGAGFDAVVDGSGVEELGGQLQAGCAKNSKLCLTRALAEGDWFTAKAEDPQWVWDTAILKNGQPRAE